MVYIISLFLSFSLYAQGSLESYMWFLNPHGQKIKIDVSDLVTEEIEATANLNYGYNSFKKYQLNKEVKVAIIDSGIDKDHKAFKNVLDLKTLAGRNFTNKSEDIEDDEGHGTHVAGIIKSFFKYDESKLKILPLKIFTQSQEDQPLPIKVYKAFDLAIKKNVDLIHLSMGWPESLMSNKLKAIIEKALDKDIIVVAAAGNSSQRANIYPCKIERVICVGALRANGELAKFSNYGPQVDFLAPGEKILSTTPTYIDSQYIPINGYDYKNGTSQAAPFVSGAALFLKSHSPSWDALDIYSRLINSAGASDYSLRGMFHIPNAIKEEAHFIIPSVKHINTLSKGKKTQILVPVTNVSQTKKINTKINFDCFGTKSSKSISLAPREKMNLSFSVFPELTQKCTLYIDSEKYVFEVKVLESMEVMRDYEITEQGIVREARNKVISSLITVPALPHKKTKAFYYKRSKKAGLKLFNKGAYLGEIIEKKECKRLRLWQADLNQDTEQDFLIEYLCDEKYIEYAFFDQSLVRIYPNAKFIPKFSIVNYKDFKLITYKNKRPEFLYINEGFNKDANNPWDSVAVRGVNLYRMSVKDDHYEQEIINDLKDFKKQLSLRYDPELRVLNLLSDKRYIVELEGERYFVNISDNKIEKTPFDLVLSGGERAAPLYGTEQGIVLNNLITPYDYISTFMDGRTLEYRHEDLADPIMNVFAVVKKESGFQVVLKTFNHLLVLKFDKFGHYLEQKKNRIERFDFLNGDQLESIVYPMYMNGSFKVLVDGTKIHTNYIDVIGKEGRSIDLTNSCTTQSPVFDEEQWHLALSCSVQGKQFLRLIKL